MDTSSFQEATHLLAFCCVKTPRPLDYSRGASSSVSYIGGFSKQIPKEEAWKDVLPCSQVSHPLASAVCVCMSLHFPCLSQTLGSSNPPASASQIAGCIDISPPNLHCLPRKNPRKSHLYSQKISVISSEILLTQTWTVGVDLKCVEAL